MAVLLLLTASYSDRLAAGAPAGLGIGLADAVADRTPQASEGWL